jgi:ribosomal protein S18 acetylase RimI-like enzyme
MRTHELEAAVSVWREANVARGAPHGAERTARIRAKLSGSDALAFVALRPEIVGMALAEPGRLDDGEGGLDPTLLHISMVFVRPAAQRTGVGLPLVLGVLDVARSLGYQRVDVWTARENTPARRLYERAGMATTGKTACVLTRTQIQYGCLCSGLSQVPQAAGAQSDERNDCGTDQPVPVSPGRGIADWGPGGWLCREQREVQVRDVRWRSELPICQRRPGPNSRVR